MRALAVLLLCGVALAGDGPPKVVSEAEWAKLIDAATDAGGTSVEIVDRLKAAAGSTLVQARGKILNVAPCPEAGDAKVAVSIVPPWGGEVTAGFVLDRAAVEGWKKWDAVTWTMQPRVDDVGQVSLAPTTAVPSRTPGTGLEPAPLANPEGSPGAYALWATAFTKAAYYGKESLTVKPWRDACAKTWVFPATVSEIRRDGALVHLEKDAHIDVSADTFGTLPGDPVGGIEWKIPTGTKKLGAWGVGPDVIATVLDQQIAEGLGVGDKVKVTIDFAASDREAAMTGAFPCRVNVWKVTKAAPRKK